MLSVTTANLHVGNHDELACVDPDVDHRVPHLSVPGDVGQPVVSVVVARPEMLMFWL